jgi:hypothetical protein
MQLRHFVSGSSVILVGWLAVTFFHQVPSQRYPKLDKYPATSMTKPAANLETTAVRSRWRLKWKPASIGGVPAAVPPISRSAMAPTRAPACNR